MRSRTPIQKQIARIAGASVCALFLTAGLLQALSRMPIALATARDDARGFWTDTFTDTTGVSALLSTTVDTMAGQVVLDALPLYAQTSWSGGAGLSTTTAITDRYQAGEGVDVATDGLLRLGYTGRAGGQMADFDGDGYPDLVFSNFFSGTNYPDGDFNTNSYVYYGSAQGYTATNRLELPTNGSGGNLVADLNNDGYLDLVFSEFFGDSHIYWGTADGYTTTNRSELAVTHGTGCSAADLDADGYLDLVLAVYEASGSLSTTSYIYWGGSSGYTETNRTALPTVGAISDYIADLDQDGYLDIVFSNYRRNGNDYAAGTYEIDSYVYWGSSSGYTTTSRLDLPTVGAHGSSVADLNGDGYLDIVFSNRHTGDGTAYVYQVSSYIYWGGVAGYTTTQRTELPTLGAFGNSVADLDGDGYWDIVFSNHQSGPMTHTVDSYIYWGGPSGYTTTQRTSLPTVGAAGATVGDLNRNGYLDLVFSNRRNGNNYNSDSYIYWGSGTRTGYTVTNRASLPTHGASGNSAVGSPIICANIALGNIYAQPITGTTSLTDAMQTPAIYPSTGVLTSSVFDGGSVHLWSKAIWNAAILAGTNITIEVATSADGSAWSSWQVAGSGSVSGTNEATLSVTPTRYLRYRATLQGSSDHGNTPTLYDVAFWGDYAFSLSPNSVVTDTPYAMHVYTLTLSNNDTTTDTFDLTHVATSTTSLPPGSWVVRMPTTLMTVPASMSATLCVTVEIPEQEVKWVTHTLTITATSRNHPAQSLTTTLATFTGGHWDPIDGRWEGCRFDFGNTGQVIFDDMFTVYAYVGYDVPRYDFGHTGLVIFDDMFTVYAQVGMDCSPP